MHGFPSTRASVIQGLSAADAESRGAAEDLTARAYWRPIHTTLRIRWRLNEDDAADLTQEFFASAISNGWFRSYDPSRARFRTFLRVCVDRFAANAHASSSRLKRGGGATLVPLEEAIAQPADSDAEADARFHQEWVRSVFALSLQALRTEAAAAGKDTHVAIFEAYDIGDDTVPRPTYRELAQQYGIPETTITNHLAWARRTFRTHVRGVLRSLAASDDEYRSDAQELLGIREP